MLGSASSDATLVMKLSSLLRTPKPPSIGLPTSEPTGQHGVEPFRWWRPSSGRNCRPLRSAESSSSPR
jgi:hypothetical protein